MYKYNKIAYLTVIPFKDTGNVAEYFIKNSKEFYLYLFPPSYKNQPTKFTYYREGKVFKSEELFFYKGNNKILIHLFYYLYYFYIISKYNIKNTYIIFYFPIYLFFSSVIKLFTNNKFVFWIWDYFPNTSNALNFYNKIVKHYNDRLQHVIYLSPNLKQIYANNSAPASKQKVRQVVSFGIKDLEIKSNPKKNTVGYIGNLRPGQGLEFLLEAARINKKLSIDFIGDGPLREDLERKVKLNKLSKRVKFYGFVTNEELYTIISRWQIAIAPYIPNKNNPTMYTEPGKIKLYIELGLPVIMTKVSYIYKDLVKYNAGIVIAFNQESFLNALERLQKNYKKYKTGVAMYKKANLYEEYYAKKFNFLENNEKKI